MPSSRYARRRAAVYERDRIELESPGIRAAGTAVRSIRAAARRALRTNDTESLRRSVASAIIKIAPILTSAMVAADLRGRYRMIESASPRLREQALVLAQSGPYAGAVEFLQRRLNLNDQQMDSLSEKYGEDAVRATRNLGLYTDRKVQETMARLVEQGSHVRGGTKRLATVFGKLGIDEVKDQSGRIISRPHKIETIFRTQVQQAYAAGRWQAAQDPDIDEIMWGWEYVTVGDDRVRPAHELLDGTKARKNDPIWNTLTPPNGFNCRCTTIEIFDDQVELAQESFPQPKVIDGQTIYPEPDKGFSFNPGNVFRDTVQMPRTMPTEWPRFGSSREIEQWASDQGIRIYTHGKVRIGRTLAEGLDFMLRRMDDVPAIWRVVDDFNQRFPNRRESVAAFAPEIDQILINPKNSFWRETRKNKGKTSHKEYLKRHWSTNHPHHPMFHEAGHALHHKHSPKMFKHKSIRNMTNETKAMIRQQVSKRASVDPYEFVAEVFSGRLTGKRYSKSILDLYNKYGGPPL